MYICVFTTAHARIDTRLLFQGVEKKQHTSVIYRIPPLTVSLNYSRSQNNVNVVYCNYKETNSSYNVIAKRNSPLL